MALHQSTVSNLIRKLVSTGLVRRQRDKDDARVARLHATKTGKRVVRSARYPRNGILLETLQRLSFDDLHKLDRNLYQVLQQMQLEVSKIVPKADHG
jgi:DNA-binding MarR family transcriptional regulator